MKPFLETIDAPGASCALLERRLDEGIPFQWHHHPEFELTLTLNSAGQRHIGDSIEHYGDNDLVLVAPNTPHSWSSRALLDGGRSHHAIVVWFTPQWIKQVIAAMPELHALSQFLCFHQGLCFRTPAVLAVKPRMLALAEATPPQRLLHLLQILLILSEDTRAVELTTGTRVPPHVHTADPRILRVAEYLQAHFDQPVLLPALAQMVHLSTSALSRAFLRNLRMSVSQYVMRLRIGKACSLLMMSDKPVALIAREVGYANLALFNRQFLRLKGCPPRAFRHAHRLIATAG